MLKKMRYVYTVYEEKSFSKAAEKLFVSQPSLSCMVKKVESSYGITIFDRTTTPISLTPEGEYYISTVEKILKLEDDMRQYLRDCSNGFVGNICFGGSSFFCTVILSGLIKQFGNEYPNIRVDWLEMRNDELISHILQRKIDFALEVDRLEAAGIDSLKFGVEELILAVPAAFSVNEKLRGSYFRPGSEEGNIRGIYDLKPVGLEPFRDIPFVFLREGNDSYSRGFNICRNAGFEPNIAMLWIVVSAIIASIFGMVGGLIAQPGKGVTDLLTGVEATEAQEYSFIDNVISWFSTNIVESMVNADMLQIIVFCLFLGVALLALGEKAKTVIKFIEEGSETMLKITEYVIEFSPFGILSLVATMVSTVSGEMMKSVIVFIAADWVICIIVLILVYPLITRLLTKLSGYGFLRKIAPAIIVAASTSSSAATLPVSIKLSEEKLGIPENIYGFTLPLGNTMGMTGFAVFIGLCCVFASNLYGFPITFGSALQFVFFGLILSIGAAGVKGAGVVMSGVLLEALGMPLTLVPILAAIWPVIDPPHTTLNNVGDLVGTTVVAKSLDKMDMAVYNKH